MPARVRRVNAVDARSSSGDGRGDAGQPRHARLSRGGARLRCRHGAAPSQEQPRSPRRGGADGCCCRRAGATPTRRSACPLRRSMDHAPASLGRRLLWPSSPCGASPDGATTSSPKDSQAAAAVSRESDHASRTRTARRDGEHRERFHAHAIARVAVVMLPARIGRVWADTPRARDRNIAATRVRRRSIAWFARRCSLPELEATAPRDHDRVTTALMVPRSVGGTGGRPGIRTTPVPGAHRRSSAARAAHGRTARPWGGRLRTRSEVGLERRQTLPLAVVAAVVDVSGR
jgi:hypothetical protein